MTASRKMSKHRQKWCDAYKRATGLDALMDDFLAGNESFADAAAYSVQWYQDHVEECLRLIPDVPK